MNFGRVRTVLLVLSLLVSVQPVVSQMNPPGIFGDDDRCGADGCSFRIPRLRLVLASVVDCVAAEDNKAIRLNGSIHEHNG